MTDYFVRKGGSDANAGTSAGAAWLTIGKALLAGSPVVGGDTIYIGAGVYRQVIAVAITPASVVTLIGDVDGLHTGDPGDVILSGFTTNDTTAASGSTLLNTNGASNLKFQKIYFLGSNANPFMSVAAASHDITFQDCVFQASGSPGACMNVNTTANVAANVLIDRCIFFSGSSTNDVRCVLATATGADFDYNITIQNCLMLNSNGAGIELTSSGANSFFGGGVRAYNNTIFGGSSNIYANSASLSTSIPAVLAYNNVLLGATSAVLRATTLGQITEDWNRIWGSTARTNTSAGANSAATTNTAAMLLEIGQSFMQGRLPRPFLSPGAGSLLLGFGAQAGGPSIDLFGRPRPAGGASTSYAVGAQERHDTGAKETTVTDASGTSMKLTGPADHELLVPVDASATVLSVRGRYDTTHGTTNKPQALLLANGEIGVTAQTLTMSVGVDTWETLTFSSFTPTAKGFVRLRLVSRAAAGGGLAYWDTLAGMAADSRGLDYWNHGELLPVANGAAAGGGSGGISRSRVLGGV